VVEAHPKMAHSAPWEVESTSALPASSGTSIVTRSGGNLLLATEFKSLIWYAHRLQPVALRAFKLGLY
jgi:hypothetical protein